MISSGFFESKKRRKDRRGYGTAVGTGGLRDICLAWPQDRREHRLSRSRHLKVIMYLVLLKNIEKYEKQINFMTSEVSAQLSKRTGVLQKKSCFIMLLVIIC